MKKRGVFHYVVTILDKLLITIAYLIISILVVAGSYAAYVTQKSPINLTLSLSLILGGPGLTLNFLWTTILVIFSSKYNRGVYKLCSPSFSR
jgi:hypothetical protein